MPEIQMDRAFLSSPFVIDAYEKGTRILSKPFPYPRTGRLDKSEFTIDLSAGTVRCPAEQTARIVNSRAKYPLKVCNACSLREQCRPPNTRNGRVILIHEHEELMQQLHAGVRDPARRQQLRERVKIEHSLAHICAQQGPRARYRTVKKNNYDMHRYATIKNLFALKRHLDAHPEMLELAA